MIKKKTLYFVNTKSGTISQHIKKTRANGVALNVQVYGNFNVEVGK